MTRNYTSCSITFAAFSGGATAHLVGADPLEGATWAAIGHMFNFLGHDGKEEKGDKYKLSYRDMLDMTLYSSTVTQGLWQYTSETYSSMSVEKGLELGIQNAMGKNTILTVGYKFSRGFRFLPGLNTVGSLGTLGYDFQQFRTGKLSHGRFGYRALSTGTSFYVGYNTNPYLGIGVALAAPVLEFAYDITMYWADKTSTYLHYQMNYLKNMASQ